MKTFSKILVLGGALAAAFAQCDGNSTGTLPDMVASDDLPSASGDMAGSNVDLPSPPDLLAGAGPTIAKLAPAKASNSGGATLTITGTNFQSGATVTVAGAACANPNVTPTQISCTVPAKSATCGPQSVVVTNPDSQMAADSTSFSYLSASVKFATATNVTVGTGPQRIVAADA